MKTRVLRRVCFSTPSAPAKDGVLKHTLRDYLFDSARLHHRILRRRSESSSTDDNARTVGSGTSAPSKGVSSTGAPGRSSWPKLLDRAVKSAVVVEPSKLKSPSFQSFSDGAPKLLARALKSNAFTTPSRLASPT